MAFFYVEDSKGHLVTSILLARTKLAGTCNITAFHRHQSESTSKKKLSPISHCTQIAFVLFAQVCGIWAIAWITWKQLPQSLGRESDASGSAPLTPFVVGSASVSQRTWAVKRSKWLHIRRANHEINPILCVSVHFRWITIFVRHVCTRTDKKLVIGSLIRCCRLSA